MAQPSIIRLTSLDWPPYAGAALPEGGSQVQLVRMAYRAVGVQVEVEFLPFRRAVQRARSDHTVAGYFPEYAEVEADFTISPMLGLSPLGFAYRADRVFQWQGLDDLVAHQPIGVVGSYINEPDLDRMIATGRLRSEPALDDLGNLRRLAAGRIGVAVIDQSVMRWLIAAEPSLRGQPQPLLFHPRLLAERTLHVAFRNSPHGQIAQDLLTAGLARLDPDVVRALTVTENSH
ncbi:MAG: ABC transporter [Alphaproteobacteria bacterium]|nr:MAG: ABC transporter [Alphaproteobacteria bacterium]